MTDVAYALQVHLRSLVSRPSSMLERKSAVVFLLSNLVWVVGVLFFGWSAFDLLFLFWLEAGVMEIFVVAKVILFAFLWKPDWDPVQTRASVASEKNRGIVFVVTVFFAFFGVCFTILWIAMGDRVAAVREGGRSVGALSDALHHLFAVTGNAITGEFAIPFWSMVTSYAFSLGYDYLYRGDIRKVVDGNYIFTIFLAPLLRVFTIVSLFFFGLFVVMLVVAVGQTFGQIDAAANFGWALALCVCKVWVDQAAHEAEKGRPVTP